MYYYLLHWNLKDTFRIIYGCLVDEENVNNLIVEDKNFIRGTNLYFCLFLWGFSKFKVGRYDVFNLRLPR